MNKTRQFLAIFAIELLLLASPGLALATHHCEDADGSHSNTHCVFCFQLVSAATPLPMDGVGLPAVQYHDWIAVPFRELSPGSAAHHRPSLPRAPPARQ